MLAQCFSKWNRNFLTRCNNYILINTSEAYAIRSYPFLQRQRRKYCILVVEQATEGAFNRAKLMNIGYHVVKMRRQRSSPLHIKSQNNNNQASPSPLPLCMAFHDVDLLPEDDRNIYACLDTLSIHTCDKIDKYQYETQFIRL